MKKLLVCVDFSDVTPAIIECAIRLAKAFHEQVVLLHVAMQEPDSAVLDNVSNMVREEWAEIFEEEHRQLLAIRDEMLQSDGKVTALIAHGDPASKIIESASEIHADMILLGSHGHGFLAHIFLGSVAEHVLRKSTCPVVIVPVKHKQDDAQAE